MAADPSGPCPVPGLGINSTPASASASAAPSARILIANLLLPLSKLHQPIHRLWLDRLEARITPQLHTLDLHHIR